MLRIKLKEVLIAKGIKNHRQWLIENCKMSYRKIQVLYSKKQKSIAFEDLSRLCKALECTPNDLFYWENTPKIMVGEWHPLMAKLSPPDKNHNWIDLIEALDPESVDELKNYMYQLNSKKQQQAKEIFDAVQKEKSLQNNSVELPNTEPLKNDDTTNQ
jgi:putative transcriptional regulator